MGGTIAPRQFNAPNTLPAAPQASNPVMIQPSGPIGGIGLNPFDRSQIYKPTPVKPVVPRPVANPIQGGGDRFANLSPFLRTWANASPL